MIYFKVFESGDVNKIPVLYYVSYTGPDILQTVVDFAIHGGCLTPFDFGLEGTLL
jgi:hypothetical protein